MNNTAPTAFAPLMFCRDTNDIESHITTGWTSQAACGAMPAMKTIGWTLGATSAWLADLTVCEACKTVRGSRFSKLYS